MTNLVTATINKGGLSFELTVDGIPRARVRLDADGGAEEKRELVEHIAWCVNKVARDTHGVESAEGE
jgi:hypothetical protein